MGDAVGVLGLDGVAGDGDVEGGDGAPADGFAVEELLVVGGGLDGVADGVAEVEDHAEAGLFFVFADDVGLDPDGGGDDLRQGCRVGVLFGGVTCIQDGCGGFAPCSGRASRRR